MVVVAVIGTLSHRLAFVEVIGEGKMAFCFVLVENWYVLHMASPVNSVHVHWMSNFVSQMQHLKS